MWGYNEVGLGFLVVNTSLIYFDLYYYAAVKIMIDGYFESFPGVDNPVIFRTTCGYAYAQSVDEGSLWLRPLDYFEKLEKESVGDKSEPYNVAPSRMKVHLSDGKVWNKLDDNLFIKIPKLKQYIACFHGPAISDKQRENFGGCTFSIKNVNCLITEIYRECIKQVNPFIDSSTNQSRNPRFGKVFYQYVGINFTRNVEAFQFSTGIYLGYHLQDDFRKDPLPEFIDQDEYRFIVYVDNYISDDPEVPLKINVDPRNFYGCHEN